VITALAKVRRPQILIGATAVACAAATNNGYRIDHRSREESTGVVTGAHRPPWSGIDGPWTE